MSKDSAHHHVQTIRKAISRLKALAWQDDALIHLRDAEQNLQKLEGYIDENAEQRRLAALSRVSLSMGVSLDLDEVLTQVMDAVLELTQAERGFLMLIDSATGNLEVRAARNIERETLDRKDMEFSRSVIGEVIESGKGVVTTDAQNDPRFSQQQSVVYYALRSVMCAPLRARNQILGVIYVDNRAQASLFTADDLSLLNTFASQAAIAIENAHLYTLTDQALAARVAELETLTKIDRKLNARLDLSLVLDITREVAIGQTGAAEGWILLSTGEDDHLEIAAGPADGFRLPLDSQVVEQCLKEISPQSISPEDGQPARLLAAMLYTGKPIGLIVVEGAATFPGTAIQFLDRLSSRAASAIQNARLYQAVQDANQAKTKFVSVVTHELRVPMTSIKGYTDLLRQGAIGPVNEMQVNFLNVVRNNVDRMSVLVSDLSDISRIESGRLNLNCLMISPVEQLHETINSLQPRADERGQTIHIQVPDNLPQIHADPVRVVQILANLVSNAVKYTPDKGNITASIRDEGDFVRYEITDDGIGISAEDQARLFSQFFRSEDPAVREQQGWGLGLSVTRLLVESMGGEIGFRSELQKGSTFWFTLPTRPIPNEV
ncbi:MAG: ATP-binding protein [Chloroflexota bacterium]